MLATVDGDPATSGKLTPVMSASMSGQIVEKNWYRVVMTADPGSPTVTGKVFKHATGTNPNSALGAQVGATLTFGSLPAGVASPGENGLIAEAVSATVTSSVTNFTNDPVACGVSGPPPPPPPTAFPATGQTTSYRAGDDGDVKAGAPLSYTDNGDGTITDNNTGLMWEKKDSSVGIHNKDTAYTWSTTGTAADGTAFTDFLATLNGGSCFADRCDWRLPTISELQTIVPEAYPCTTIPCIDPVFGPTVADGCWSSTSRDPTYAWFGAFFFPDGPSYTFKDDSGFVRAVRTGS
jgi:hypothetical protein